MSLFYFVTEYSKLRRRLTDEAELVGSDPRMHGLLLEGFEFPNHILSACFGNDLLVGDTVQKTQFVLEDHQSFSLLHRIDLHFLIKNDLFRITILQGFWRTGPTHGRRHTDFR